MFLLSLQYNDTELSNGSLDICCNVTCSLHLHLITKGTCNDGLGGAYSIVVLITSVIIPDCNVHGVATFFLRRILTISGHLLKFMLALLPPC